MEVLLALLGLGLVAAAPNIPVLRPVAKMVVWTGVVVGEGASVGPDAQVDDSVLHAGAVVGAGARIVGSVLGPRARVGAGASVVSSALAEGAIVPPGLQLEGAKVSAGQTAG